MLNLVEYSWLHISKRASCWTFNVEHTRTIIQHATTHTTRIQYMIIYTYIQVWFYTEAQTRLVWIFSQPCCPLICVLLNSTDSNLIYMLVFFCTFNIFVYKSDILALLFLLLWHASHLCVQSATTDYLFIKKQWMQTHTCPDTIWGLHFLRLF